MRKQPVETTAALSSRTNILSPLHWAVFCDLWLKAVAREHAGAPECSTLKHCCTQVERMLQIAHEQLDVAAPECRTVRDCLGTALCCNLSDTYLPDPLVTLL